MKIQRLITILTILLQVDKIPAGTLAKKFEVSVRTIYRDIETLEAAGIPIVTYAGVSGGISILGSYKLNKLLFTQKDIENLLSGINTIADVSPDGSLAFTLEKIKTLLPEQIIKSIELSSNQLYIDMSPWAQNPLFKKKINTIQAAIKNNSLVDFTYTSRHETAHKRTAEPHQLILKENNWYLRAFCRQREDFRIFRLERMSEIEVLEETFSPRKFEKNTTDFKDWQNETAITIQLLISKNLKDRTLDFCKEEQIHQLPNGDFLVTMPFIESEMGYNFILGLGAECELKSPPHVREELARRIRLLANKYQV